ncbi:MAG: sulfate reduction electron transfer complex DsrMKJOP subunit DsrO [Desulfovibrionaceae bacterium]
MKNRRSFLKFAGLSVAGLCLSPAGALASGGASGPKVGAEQRHAARWGMVIDSRKLTTDESIEPLVAACKKAHNIPDIPAKDAPAEHGVAHAAEHGEEAKAQVKQEIKWIWSAGYHQCFPEQANPLASEEVENRRFVLLCNHCANPPCVRVCPTKATFQRPDGIVAMDYHRCIGCRYCMAGCPYGSRSFNFRDPKPYVKEENRNPEFPSRMRGVVEKCNFCVDRLAKGLNPACVEASDGALTFGDLGDENSEIRQVLRENFTMRRKPSLGTEPSVFYIV